MKHRVILVIGGVRSGKSAHAQKLAESFWRRPLFLATAEVTDAEMAGRIRRHRRARGRRWACVEEPLDLGGALKRRPKSRDGVLVDCVTVWLSNVLVKEGASAIPSRKKALMAVLRKPPCDVILVSNEVGMGVVPDTELGRAFRDLQGRLNQELAAVADTVVFTVAGLPMVLKDEG